MADATRPRSKDLDPDPSLAFGEWSFATQTLKFSCGAHTSNGHYRAGYPGRKSNPGWLDGNPACNSLDQPDSTCNPDKNKTHDCQKSGVANCIFFIFQVFTRARVCKRGFTRIYTVFFVVNQHNTHE